jgi:hypothetical protein
LQKNFAMCQRATFEMKEVVEQSGPVQNNPTIRATPLFQRQPVERSLTFCLGVNGRLITES